MPLLIRKQEEGYLFPHVDELDDSEPELQPIATINFITRSRNYDQAAASDEQTKNTSGNSSPKSTTTKIDNTRLRVVTGSNPTSSSTNKLSRGNRYVITLTDYLSKFAFVKAVKINSAQEAADFFLDVCYHCGAPSKLITDQGSHFVAELTRAIIESCNTTHILATPHHPTSNAQTERFNTTFAPALSKLTSDQTLDWDEFLQHVIYAYNTSKHTTTSLTPIQIMFTRENQLIMDPKKMKISLMKPNEYYEKAKQSRVLFFNHVKLNIKHQLVKTRHDKNRPDPKYVKGDLVLVRVIIRTSKFQEKFEGPYRITNQIGSVTFIVKIENLDNDENTNYTKQVTTADMKHIFSFEVV
ncbi:unnamed protein product [Rotaria magnacalcarata]|uniref:Integrase catalytic domain-containing protein n=1 Tax=Rotaria magnacalcarata TaxID=392030 RepID=A0A8S2KCR1_9BILA|nr:unnamed protein product [Rotaria magnacalcarata]